MKVAFSQKSFQIFATLVLPSDRIKKKKKMPCVQKAKPHRKSWSCVEGGGVANVRTKPWTAAATYPVTAVTERSKSTVCYQRGKHRPGSAADLCSVGDKWEEFPKCRKKQLLRQQRRRRRSDLRKLHPEQDVETFPALAWR